MKALSVTVKANLTDGITPIKKAFVHEDVMALVEEDERYVVFLPNTKLMYSKKHYEVKQ